MRKVAKMSRQFAMVAMMLMGGVMAGCHTKHEIIFEQPKPLEVNVNLTGRLELVVVDARKDMEQITGEKPQQVVTPADIGLPETSTQTPGTQPTSMGPGVGGVGGRGLGGRRMAALVEDGARPVVELVSFGARETPALGRVELVAAAQSPGEAAKARMAQRDGQIRTLWNSGAIGEAHTGLVVAKGNLTADQQKLIAAENADRQTLYAEEAKQKNTPEAQVALGYYVARLGYAKKGDWYEKFDKGTNAWAWKKWGE